MFEFISMDSKKAQRFQKKPPVQDSEELQPQQNSKEPSWFNTIYRGFTDKNPDWDRVVKDWESGKLHRKYPNPKSWLGGLFRNYRW